MFGIVVRRGCRAVLHVGARFQAIFLPDGWHWAQLGNSGGHCNVFVPDERVRGASYRVAWFMNAEAVVLQLRFQTMSIATLVLGHNAPM